MDASITIQPITYTKTNSYTIDNIIISVVQFILFQSLTLQVSLRSGENIVDIKGFIIDGEEYANWSTDDNYIVNLIAQKLNIQVTNFIMA